MSNKIILAILVVAVAFLMMWEFVPLHHNVTEEREWTCSFDTDDERDICDEAAELFEHLSGESCYGYVWGWDSETDWDHGDWTCYYDVEVRTLRNP